jgi:hypothetical protein
MSLTEWVQGVRQSEDDMEVGHGEQTHLVQHQVVSPAFPPEIPMEIQLDMCSAELLGFRIVVDFVIAKSQKNHSDQQAHLRNLLTLWEEF